MARVKRGIPIHELSTPAILLDLGLLEENIKEVYDLAKTHGKEMWPMVKTHKSLEIMKMQGDSGAAGFLCGTIDEAELLVNKGGYKDVMLAYPVADKQNLRRCMALLQKSNPIFRLDSEEAASLLDDACSSVGKVAEYQIKIDSGLHRFGVAPERAGRFAQDIRKYKNLNLVGIGTHAGTVYASKSPVEVKKKSLEALESLHIAHDDLKRNGFELKMITTGSTPSFSYDIEDDLVTAVHPGNYVYYDAMQIALGTVPSDRCALTVLVTVNSKHQERGSAAINAGVKIFSRDIGGHGITVVTGYGIIKGYPKATVVSLSEEVGLLDIKEEPSINIGDKLEIIPNHACSVNNQTSYLIGHREGIVEKAVAVDARVGT